MEIIPGKTTVFVRGAWFRAYEQLPSGNWIVGRKSGFRMEVTSKEIEQSEKSRELDVIARSVSRKESLNKTWGKMQYLPRRTD